MVKLWDLTKTWIQTQTFPQDNNNCTRDGKSCNNPQFIQARDKMRFDKSAVGAVSMIPFIDVQQHDSGEAHLTPPTAGAGTAFIDLTNFSGKIAVECTVTFYSTGYTKTLITESTTESESESSDDELEVPTTSNNTGASSSVSNITTETTSNNTRASSSVSNITTEPASRFNFRLGGPSTNDGLPDYEGVQLPELKLIFKQRFGKFPSQKVKKADVRRILEEWDAEHSTVGASADEMNGGDNERSRSVGNETVEVSDDDDDALDDTEVNPAPVDALDGTEDEPANPDGNEFGGEPVIQDGNGTPNVDDNNASNEEEAVNWGEMTVNALKKYFKDQHFEGKIPKKKSEIIALIKEKLAERSSIHALNDMASG